jgi:hypothetical protein
MYYDVHRRYLPEAIEATLSNRRTPSRYDGAFATATRTPEENLKEPTET